MADANLRIVIEAVNKAKGELDKVKTQLTGVDTASEKATKSTKTTAQSMKDMGTQMLAAAGVVTSGVLAIKKAYTTLNEGADMLRVRDSSAALAASMGSDMDKIVEAVRTASRGTVSELDIMSSASRAMMLGLGGDADKLGNLMEVAALRGRMMGLDATQAFSDIVTGIGRMSPMILDNLGITVDAAKTYDDYAKSIGKTAEQLTSAEKKQALLNRVLEEGNKMLAETGGLADDAASSFERLEANWKNFSNNVKIWAAEHTDLGGAMNFILFGGKDIKDQMREQDKYFAETATTYAGYLARIYSMRVSATDAGGWLFGTGQYKPQYSEEMWSAMQYKGASDTSASAGFYNGKSAVESLAGAFDTASAAVENYKQQLSQADQLQRDFNQLQSDWAESTGGEVANLLGGSMAEGSERYRQGLQAIDEIMGTTLEKELNHKQAVEELAQAYARTGDVEAFKEGLKALEEIDLADQKAELAGVKDEVQALYDYWVAFGALPHEYDIKVNFIKTGSAGGISADTVFGYANGGDFIVPPGYPNDSYTMGVTSGEHVSVTPKGQGDKNYFRLFGPISFNVNGNVSEADLMSQLRV